ncbi:PKD domain-containing protein [Euzebyella marina]|uniref:PKD domain-containing protein n=1 Tax=Euzebyella marina TaxID=1761453 RepID=A0A3G2L4M2_9FLAO|nr:MULTISPECIES: PQQ-dependent sugar dehydrogenase [Bacteroidota]AYN67199.1 PKD domain-containing protein [Euzebyella marina]
MKKIYTIRACNSAFFSIFHLHYSKFCSISNKIVGGLILALALLSSISVKGQLPDDFQQVPLLTGLANATTMQFAPDGRIFILDRYGEVIIYKTDTQTSVSAGTVPVFHEFEEGLLGIAFDPDFITNNYIYLHYAVLGQSTNRVSRFTMNGDVLDMSSEIVMLEWGTQRIISYHSGGDMAFDSQGNLYIAVGDNSYYSDAYASHNETSISATTEKSSSNTNDMRGKILRITPQNDGSYTIPAGNLFPAGTPNTLPEIYVMGARNPYRIFVDKENTDWLFWGEVGPDANAASALGPEGLDEMNLTKASGNYGWPYFSGVDNDAYQVAYRTPSPFYNDPAAPENTSTWNTGATVLPPAQPAWLEFFHKSHFAGPRYYYDGALTDDQRFPVEFDEIFFYYDFNSSKIWAVEMDAQGNIISNDLFAPAVFPSGSGDGFIDMEFGPDGKMYILAYGAGCCPQNAGTGKLIRVDYTGITSNAPPTVMISADPNSGPLPLTVNFSSAGTNDPNGDTPLTYEWDFDGDGNTDSNDENPTHVYNTAGTFNVKLTVTDPGGAFGVNNITIYAGNTAATFSYNLPPDGGFIGWGDDVSIDLIVSDTEDGSTGSGIDCNDVNVVPALGHLNHFHDLATMTGCTQNFNLGYDGHDITGEMDIFYVLNANYTDQGGLTAFDQILLHPKRKEAEYFDTQNGTTIITNTDFLEGGSEALSVDNNGYISFSERNLLNMTAVKYKVAAATAGGTIEFRLGSPTGTLLATTTVPSTGGLGNWQAVESIFSAPVGKNDLFFVFKSTSGTQDIFNLNYVEFIGDGVSTDSSPPEISSVEAMGSTQVKVQFSEYVTAATANQVSNYVIDNGIAISSAVLQSDGLTVFLTVSPLSGDTTYNLTVNDVQNISGIPIVTEDYSFSIISSIRINVGGPQLTYGAETFIADQYSTGGSLFSASMPINGTTQDELYQTERFGSFSYEIPVPVSGEYDIRLHFAELYFGIGSVPGGPGTRVFNVTIEGNPVLTNFDISAEVDPATALQKELDDISITDGFASITLTSINENPKLSAIEILPPDAFASTPDIMITSPQNGWSVNQPFEVAFMVENWTIQEGDTHIHYYIDGVMVEPYYSHDPIPLDNLSIGSHTIRVELFFANHSPTGIFDEVMVAVTEQSVCNETDFPDSWIVHQLDQNPYTAVYTFADDDLDGDGLKDIVTGGWWYKNSGSASSNWQKSTIGGTFGNVVHVHDFDGDGDIDLLGTALGIAPDNEYESAQLLWAQNDGSGNFTVFTNIPAGNTNYSEPFLAGLAGGDFGAGYQMAINWNGAESTGSPVQMLTPSANPTTGMWSLVDISPDSAGEDLQAGDIDGDGDLDLFQGVNWLRNNGGGTWETFSTGITYVTTPDRAQLADFDRDGDLDAVVGQLGLGSNPNNSEFAWFAAPADPTQPWVRNILATDIAGSLSVFAIDFDFDGDQDIVVGEWLADRRLIVFENDLCSTGDWETQIIDDGSLNLEHHDGARVTDIDNDGDLDVVSNGWLQHMGPRIYENTTPPPVSNDPIADAGQDQTVVLPSNSITLNGSGTDPNGGSITGYQWTQVSGPTTATLVGETTADLTASDLVLGSYVFRLTVIDDENETGFDEVTVMVSSEGGNMPPVAVAEAAPLTGVAPLEVTFTGGNSSDDVGVVAYAWDFGDGGTSTEMNPIYTYNEADTYTVTLTVTDEGNRTSTATLSITVTDGTSGKMEVILAENPSKGGVAKIRVINAPADMVVLKIYLHDVGGRYIAVYNAPDVLSADGTYDIPASTLRDGVYFLGVEMNQGKPTLIKLIVDN